MFLKLKEVAYYLRGSITGVLWWYHTFYEPPCLAYYLRQTETDCLWHSGEISQEVENKRKDYDVSLCTSFPVVDCGEPEPGLNVNLTTENPTYNFTSILEYVCADPIYACFGRSISCQSDGQWSGSVPTCSELNFYSHEYKNVRVNSNEQWVKVFFVPIHLKSGWPPMVLKLPEVFPKDGAIQFNLP